MIFIEVLCAFLLIIFCGYLFHRKLSIINPILIYSCLWAFVIGTYSLHLFGLYRAETKMFLIMVLGIAIFIVFCILIRKLYDSNYFPKSFNKNTVYILRKKFVSIVGIICILYFSKNFILSIMLMIQGNSMDVIRTIAQDPNSILNQVPPILNLLQNFLVLPFATAIEVLAVVEFWRGEKKSPVFIINLIILFMRILSDGGRTPLVNFCLYMVCGYFLFTDFSIKEKIKTTRIIKYSSIGGVLLLITSLARSGTLLFRHIYLYFAMSPYMFSSWGEQANIREIYGFGSTAINGFIFPIAYLIKNITNSTYPRFISLIYDFIAETDSTWVKILPGQTKANAYVSATWFFYVDGRWLGVVIGMALYGALLMYSYLTATKTESIRSKACYLLLLQGLFFSFIRFPFAKSYYSLALLIILFIAYESKNNLSQIKIER